MAQRQIYDRSNLFSGGDVSDGLALGSSRVVSGLGRPAVITINNPGGASVRMQRRRSDRPQEQWSYVGNTISESTATTIALQASMDYRWVVTVAGASPVILTIRETDSEAGSSRVTVTNGEGNNSSPSSLLENEVVLKWSLGRAQEGYWTIANPLVFGSNGVLYRLNPNVGGGIQGNPEINPTLTQGTAQSSWIAASQSGASAVEFDSFDLQAPLVGVIPDNLPTGSESGVNMSLVRFYREAIVVYTRDSDGWAETIRHKPLTSGNPGAVDSGDFEDSIVALVDKPYVFMFIRTDQDNRPYFRTLEGGGLTWKALPDGTEKIPTSNAAIKAALVPVTARMNELLDVVISNTASGIDYSADIKAYEHHIVDRSMDKATFAIQEMVDNQYFVISNRGANEIELTSPSGTSIEGSYNGRKLGSESRSYTFYKSGDHYKLSNPSTHMQRIQNELRAGSVILSAADATTTFTLYTNDGQEYTVKYPDDSVEIVASGVSQSKTTQAGIIELIFKDMQGIERLDLSAGAWSMSLNDLNLRGALAERFYSITSSTLRGDIVGFIYNNNSIDYLRLENTDDVGGNLEEASFYNNNMDFFYVTGSGVLYGDIVAIFSNWVKMRTFVVASAHKMYGNLAEAAKHVPSLSRLSLGDNSIISGDIADVIDNCPLLTNYSNKAYGSRTCSRIPTFPSTMRAFVDTNANLTSIEVDRLLEALASVTTWTVEKKVDLTGNEAPSAAGIEFADALEPSLTSLDYTGKV